MFIDQREFMEITSLYFALISIVTVFIFYLTSPRYRITLLSLLSCFFLATYSYILLFYVIAFSLINYYFGILIATTNHGKVIFRIGITINLLQLFLMKYASVFFKPINLLFNADLNFSILYDLVIPVGISYFTLQGIGYLINIKLRWEKPEKKFLHFFLYIAFYPKFLSGPIERSNHFLPLLKTLPPFDSQRIIDGLRLALFGVFKKVVIANQLAPFVIYTYTNIDSADSSTLWLMLLINPLYLYFDFSGYTDIAIGFAKTLGIDLLPNFNKPFMSENMTTFWKRFHISLSAWFNDYVFKQTVFRLRKWGIYASIVSVFATWMLFGIWHGAGGTFMLLGLLQAIAILYEFFTKSWRIKLFSKLPDRLRIWVGRFFTYVFFGSALVFFFAPNIRTAFHFYANLWNVNGFMIEGIRPSIFIMTLSFMILILVFETIQNDFKDYADKIENFWTGNKIYQRVARWVLYLVSISAIIVLGNEVQQFIYFQF